MTSLRLECVGFKKPVAQAKNSIELVCCVFFDEFVLRVVFHCFWCCVAVVGLWPVMILAVVLVFYLVCVCECGCGL